MKGVINGHRLTQEEDRLFSETVFLKIIERGRLYSQKSKDEEHYNLEKREYFASKYRAYCDCLEDILAREDTCIRGKADAYNEIVTMLNDFSFNCSKKIKE